MEIGMQYNDGLLETRFQFREQQSTRGRWFPSLRLPHLADPHHQLRGQQMGLFKDVKEN